MAWTWIDIAVVIAVHDQVIADHGGKDGIRDFGLLESSLSRPRNRDVHEKTDVYGLAAEYAYGLTRNHAFIDGNKRTAYVVTRLFLRLNHHDLTAPAPERVAIIEKLAKGEISLKQFAGWLRQHGVGLK